MLFLILLDKVCARRRHGHFFTELLRGIPNVLSIRFGIFFGKGSLSILTSPCLMGGGGLLRSKNIQYSKILIS